QEQRANVEASLLASIRGFKSGEQKSSDGNALQRLADNLKEHNAKESDILLLLDSADCTPINPIRDLTNEKLAELRAIWVGSNLQRTASPKIVVSKLPQHSNCKEADTLRAVNAFLIQLKPQKAN